MFIVCRLPESSCLVNWSAFVPTDADHMLLDENHAKSFLKRDNCQYYQEKAEEVHERQGGVKGFFISKADLKEECCGEGCNAEEMYENMHQKEERSYERVRVKPTYLYQLLTTGWNITSVKNPIKSTQYRYELIKAKPLSCKNCWIKIVKKAWWFTKNLKTFWLANLCLGSLLPKAVDTVASFIAHFSFVGFLPRTHPHDTFSYKTMKCD